MRIHVGMGMVVAGALSCSLSDERVVSVLQAMQNNLFEHVSQWIGDKKARDLLGKRFRPREDATSSSPLEKLEHPDFMPFSADAFFLRQLLQPSESTGTRQILETPVIFATVSTLKGLQATLNFAHRGRPLVHLMLSEGADLTLLTRVCGGVTGGCSDFAPLTGSASGHVVISDPLGAMDALVPEGDKSLGWLDRMLWLGEHNAGPSFEADDNKDTAACFGRAGERFEKALEAVVIKRLDFHKQEPMQLQCELEAVQVEWNKFLRTLESHLPGITGELRSLPASLIFGLWQMVIVDGKSSKEFDVKAVMAFSRMLALRMVHARDMLRHDGRRTRIEAFATNIRHKLVDGPLTVRDLIRKSHRLDSATSQEALERLADSGLLVRNGSQWSLTTSNKPQALTFNV